MPSAKDSHSETMTPSTGGSRSSFGDTLSSNPIFIGSKNDTAMGFAGKRINLKKQLSIIKDTKSAPSSSGGRISRQIKKQSNRKIARSYSLPDLKQPNVSTILQANHLYKKSLSKDAERLTARTLPDINKKVSTHSKQSVKSGRNILNSINTLETKGQRGSPNDVEARLASRGVKITKESEVVKEHIEWIVSQVKKISAERNKRTPPATDDTGNHLPILHQTNFGDGDTLLVSLLKKEQQAEEDTEEKGFIVRLKWIKRQLEESEIKLWEYSENQKILLEKIKTLQLDLDSEKSRSTSLYKQLLETTSFLKISKASGNKFRSEADSAFVEKLSVAEKEYKLRLYQQEQTIRAEIRILDHQLQLSQTTLIETQRMLLEVEREREELKLQINDYKQDISQLQMQIITLQEEISVSGNTNVTLNSIRHKLEKEFTEKSEQQIKAAETDMERKIRELQEAQLGQMKNLNEEHLKRDKEWVLRSTQDELRFKETLLKYCGMEKKQVKDAKEIAKLKEELEVSAKLQTDSTIEVTDKIQKIQAEYEEKISSAQSWYEQQISYLNEEIFRLNEMMVMQKNDNHDPVDEESHNAFQLQITRLQVWFDEQINSYQQEIARLKAAAPANNKNTKAADIHNEYQGKISRLEALHKEEIGRLKDGIQRLQTNGSDEQKIQDIHNTYQDRISSLQAMYEEQFRKNNEEISKLKYQVENPPSVRTYEVKTQTESPTSFLRPLWCCYWYCRCLGYTSQKISPDDEVQLSQNAT